ncbi:MAG: molybdopterin-dependent oxidoreductase, partial [Bdellovibrionota bacterium]
MENHTSSETPKSEFTPPRHWIATEELQPSYWANPANAERRGQEFWDKPIEAIAKIDAEDKSGIARRDFLTIMGASMAMASFACARRPVHKIIPYVVKPEEITPGVANYYASTNPFGYGILVKNREGRPIKIDGNPDFPLNGGTLSARDQAAILDLYDQDRLKGPIARPRGGAKRDIGWPDADQAIVAKLKSSKRVRVLSGQIHSESTNKLIREFLGAFSSGEHVVYEPTGLDEIAEAQAASYGSAVVPNYRFDQAEMVVSLGADFLGTWNSPVEHSNQWIKNRKVSAQKSASAKMSSLTVFEPTFSLTGANADERHPVRPGDELKVALALAHELIVVRKHGALSGDASLAALLSGYKPEVVAQEIGFEPSVIRKLADRLSDHQGKSLIVGGGLASKTKDAVALQIAVNLLNSTLGNDGATVDGGSALPARGGFADLAKLLGEMRSGSVDVLIVYRSNPAFVLPRTPLGVEEAFKKVPLVVVVTDRDDETAQWADFVLPDHHFLENWGDSNVRKGLYSLQQPTLAPIHSTRAFQDSLIAWSKATGGTGYSAKAADWHDYVRNTWQGLHRENGVTAPFEQFWEGALRSGVFMTGSQSARGAARAFRAGSASGFPKYSVGAGSELTLALEQKISMGDGRSANNPWLQELPDPISTVAWDNYLNVAPATAARLGIKDDDVVEVKAGDVTVELPVNVQPGMHPSAVSVAVGYGRRNCGKIGDQTGVDVFPMVRAEGNRLVFSGQTVSVRKTGKYYRLAKTQWHGVTEDRPIINDVTLAQFRKSPAAVMHTDPELKVESIPSMWPVHEYKGYRWGMGIDLTSCIGCGACTVACQAENNIPVVGRDQVRVSREMHWIRIDRYYSGA